MMTTTPAEPIAQQRRTGRSVAWRPVGTSLAALVAGFLLGAGVVGSEDQRKPDVRNAAIWGEPVAVTTTPREWPRRPIPGEWQLHRRTVQYDHMFPSRR